MEDRRWAWEDVLEEVIASWEAAHEDDEKRAHEADWVVDCMMGCYNFTEPEED